MIDPLGLAVLGAAATQTIAFLYTQAGELLKARRARRDDPGAALDVPIVRTEVLDRTPTSARVDGDLLDREHGTLKRLAAELATVANGFEEPDVEDAELAASAGRLRALLEALYGQRLTFRGEHRDPSGGEVDVTQLVGDVHGQVVGADADVEGGSMRIGQTVGDVHDGGDVTGFRGRVR